MVGARDLLTVLVYGWIFVIQGELLGQFWKRMRLSTKDTMTTKKVDREGDAAGLLRSSRSAARDLGISITKDRKYETTKGDLLGDPSPSLSPS
jgi:hypothetical protein